MNEKMKKCDILFNLNEKYNYSLYELSQKKEELENLEDNLENKDEIIDLYDEIEEIETDISLYISVTKLINKYIHIKSVSK